MPSLPNVFLTDNGGLVLPKKKPHKEEPDREDDLIVQRLAENRDFRVE
jgi:hypothetical protein